MTPLLQILVVIEQASRIVSTGAQILANAVGGGREVSEEEATFVKQLMERAEERWASLAPPGDDNDE